MRTMLGVALLLSLMFATPAAAQIGLTPEVQVAKFCHRAMELRRRGLGDGTAIDSACGSQAAIAATAALGRPGLENVLTLLAAARAARNSRLQSPNP